MGWWRAVAGLGLLAALAGCEVVENEDPLIGPDRDFGEALEIGEAQWKEVRGIARDEGPTRWVQLPDSGTGAYRGVVTGWANGGIPVDYVADLALEVDFDSRDVSGSIENMVTDGVAGFTHPDGKVPLYGMIRRGSDRDARIVVDGSGPLRGPGMEARFLLDGEGGFVGDDGQAIRGRHATDFVWRRGYLAGTTSRSDGVFTAIARD